MKFFDLIVFPYKCLDYTGCINVFLNRIVQLIILIKYLDKMRMCFFCNIDQRSSENRNYNQEQQSDLYIDKKCHDPGQKHHDRGSCQKTDTHHVCHLYVCDIGCHSGDKTGC